MAAEPLADSDECPKRDDGLHWFDLDDRCIYCGTFDLLRIGGGDVWPHWLQRTDTGWRINDRD